MLDWIGFNLLKSQDKQRMARQDFHFPPITFVESCQVCSVFGADTKADAYEENKQTKKQKQ